MNTTSSSYQWGHPKFNYLEATTVEGACSLLSQYKDKAKLIAGGTDLLVSMRRKRITPLHVVNIKTIPNLDYINYDGDSLRIGALAVLSDIESSSLVRHRFPVISYSAHQIGTPQIRNVATIGGNFCNAAPSADMAPSLIGLGAKAKLQGPEGQRVVALEEFFTGPGVTILQTGEILIEIEVPNPPANTRGVYLKLPARTAIGLAVVGIAAIVTLDSKGTSIVDIKIVLGAVAPTPVRARKAENILTGRAIEDKLIEEAAQVAADEANPISDVRSTASYRKEMVKVLTNRAIREAVTSAKINK